MRCIQICDKGADAEYLGSGRDGQPHNGGCFGATVSSRILIVRFAVSASRIARQAALRERDDTAKAKSGSGR